MSLSTSALFIKRGTKVSCNFEGFFESILLQDTVIEQNLYLITRYSYFKRKVSYYKVLLLISVSRYYLQDTKIRYCPSLIIDKHPKYFVAYQNLMYVSMYRNLQHGTDIV